MKSRLNSPSSNPSTNQNRKEKTHPALLWANTCRGTHDKSFPCPSAWRHATAPRKPRTQEWSHTIHSMLPTLPVSFHAWLRSRVKAGLSHKDKEGSCHLKALRYLGIHLIIPGTLMMSRIKTAMWRLWCVMYIDALICLSALFSQKYLCFTWNVEAYLP